MESPLAHRPFPTAEIHQAYHHYLKVGGRSVVAYMCLYVHHLYYIYVTDVGWRFIRWLV